MEVHGQLHSSAALSPREEAQLGGSQTKSESFGDEKNLLYCWEPNPGLSNL